MIHKSYFSAIWTIYFSKNTVP